MPESSPQQPKIVVTLDGMDNISVAGKNIIRELVQAVVSGKMDTDLCGKELSTVVIMPGLMVNFVPKHRKA